MNNKEKSLILKKSASTNEIGAVSAPNFILREAKSYAGTMANSKFYDTLTTQRYHNNSTQENCLELFCKDYDMKRKSGIATKDLLTQEVFYVGEELLNYKGKMYSQKEIAWLWKKDCRMWLWKNNNDFKKDRSVDKIKIKG